MTLPFLPEWLVPFLPKMLAAMLSVDVPDPGVDVDDLPLAVEAVSHCVSQLSSREQ